MRLQLSTVAAVVMCAGLSTAQHLVTDSPQRVLNTSSPEAIKSTAKDFAERLRELTAKSEGWVFPAAVSALVEYQAFTNPSDLGKGNLTNAILTHGPEYYSMGVDLDRAEEVACEYTRSPAPLLKLRRSCRLGIGIRQCS
jgi:hypothetical protein